jgi:hypothetical protein
MSKLTTIHRRIIVVALAILGGKSADPIWSANLLRETRLTSSFSRPLF